LLKREELSNIDSCLNRARQDERIFVLLERDIAAPGTVRDWCIRRIRAGKNHPEDAQIMEAWAWANQAEDSPYSDVLQYPPTSPDELEVLGPLTWRYRGYVVFRHRGEKAQLKICKLRDDGEIVGYGSTEPWTPESWHDWIQVNPAETFVNSLEPVIPGRSTGLVDMFGSELFDGDTVCNVNNYDAEGNRGLICRVRRTVYSTITFWSAGGSGIEGLSADPQYGIWKVRE
jgi:hypothetical protein